MWCLRIRKSYLGPAPTRGWTPRVPDRTTGHPMATPPRRTALHRHNGATRSASQLARCPRVPDRRVALLAGLLAISLGGLGHARDGAPPTPMEPHAAPLAAQSRPVALPAAAHGVWYRDDAAGHAQCGRYRALPAAVGETDDGWMSLVGSVVITPRLVHEYSEYGEGDFHAVREIERVGEGSWRVRVEVGVDSIPADDADTGAEAYLLELQQDRLGWRPYEATEGRSSR